MDALNSGRTNLDNPIYSHESEKFAMSYYQSTIPDIFQKIHVIPNHTNSIFDLERYIQNYFETQYGLRKKYDHHYNTRYPALRILRKHQRIFRFLSQSRMSFLIFFDHCVIEEGTKFSHIINNLFVPHLAFIESCFAKFLCGASLQPFLE